MANWREWLGSRGSGLDVSGVDTRFGEALYKLLSDAERETGSTARLNDLYRDPMRQAQYRANYLGKPVSYGGRTFQPLKRGGLAAAPGRSRHQLGQAGDIASGPILDYAHANAGDYGLEFLKGRAFTADPVHIQLARALNPGEVAAATSSSNLAGGTAGDVLAESSWQEPDYDPVSGGSKHAYSISPDESTTTFRTDGGNVVVPRDTVSQFAHEGTGGTSSSDHLLGGDGLGTGRGPIAQFVRNVPNLSGGHLFSEKVRNMADFGASQRMASGRKALSKDMSPRERSRLAAALKYSEGAGMSAGLDDMRGFVDTMRQTGSGPHEAQGPLFDFTDVIKPPGMSGMGTTPSENQANLDMMGNLDAAMIPSVSVDPEMAGVKAMVDPIAKAAGASQAERNALMQAITEYKTQTGQDPAREDIIGLLRDLRQMQIQGQQ